MSSAFIHSSEYRKLLLKKAISLSLTCYRHEEEEKDDQSSLAPKPFGIAPHHLEEVGLSKRKGKEDLISLLCLFVCCCCCFEGDCLKTLPTRDHVFSCWPFWQSDRFLNQFLTTYQLLSRRRFDSISLVLKHHLQRQIKINKRLPHSTFQKHWFWRIFWWVKISPLRINKQH